MIRRPTLSVRFKLTLSYAAVFVIACFGLMVFLYLNYVWRNLEYERLHPSEPTGDGATMMNYFQVLMLETGGFFFGIIGLFIIGVFGAWFLAGRILRPLQEIREATRKTTEGSLSHRIRLTGPKDEFRQVADAFDNMLTYIERSVGEHQRFAANASHELRTPLAISRSLIEVGRTDPHADAQAVLTELDAANARAIELTEALLLLSRIDASQFEFEPVDLALITDHITESNTKLADQHGISINIDTESRHINGSTILLEQLVNNLVRNAIVHNLPVDGHIWVSVGGNPDQPRITIENTGTKLTDQEVTELIEPFRRGSERSRTTATHHVGAGLGLALVASITRAHNADLNIRPRATGGLTATVTFNIEANHTATP
ncbi:sensor histidine kinase [Microlunatus sp. GCM10028923]|uniref:sensor histidine kinase n=1 Tax=Microlunatus sp. GCM10028923 TaxID=3273400 RepID=UPI0036093AD6